MRTGVDLPAGLEASDARELRPGDRLLLRWRGEGQGLPRVLDGAWATLMAVSRDRVTVRTDSPRGEDLHSVALAAVARVERAPTSKEGP
jgi:hypothetical protein